MSYGKFLDESGDLFKWRKKNNLPDQSYELTFAVLRDIWIKDKRYSELISFINENWDSGNGDEFCHPFSKHLIEKKELRHFKSLWKGILRHRINKLWDNHKFISYEYPKITLDEIKKYNIDGFNQFSSQESDLRRFCWERQYALNGIKEYKAGLIKLNDSEEIDRIEKIYQSIDKLNKPKPQKTVDKRKIDENIFWELIEENRKKSKDKIDFIEHLSNKLTGFKPIEIKRFERIFLTKFQELNKWDIWALAYIVRRGCGDDAFDYFKAWVISKGKKAYDDIKDLRLSELKPHFDEDPQLEEMLSISENVFENKTGEIMPSVKVKRQKILGKEWNENNLQNEYSEIWKLFEHRKNCP